MHHIRSCFPRFFVVIEILLALALGSSAAVAELTPAITPDLIDVAHSGAFLDGKQVAPVNAAAIESTLGLGAEKTPWTIAAAVGQTRYFRIAFTTDVAIGTVCTPDYPGSEKVPLKALDGQFVSVLKPGAVFPGDVTDDSQWMLLPSGSVKYLPAGFRTRALRLADVSSDSETRPRSVAAGQVVCLKERCYDALDMGYLKHVENRGDPEVLQAGWMTAQAVAGVVVFSTKPADFKLEILNPGVDTPVSEAARTDWTQKAAVAGRSEAVVSFAKSAETCAVSVTGPVQVGQDGIMETLCPLVLLGDRTESPGIETEAPVKVAYDMPMPGFIALEIDDKNGNRVRRLVAEVARDKGPQAEPWDLKDDNGGVVPPGDYTWKAVARPPFKLTYEMTAYNAGIPAWWAPPPAKGGGGWLADHTPPSSAASYGDTMWLSAPCAESGHSLIATDLDGIKLWGCGMFPFGFDGPKAVAADANYGYAMNTASVWRVDPKNKFALRPVFNVPNPFLPGEPWGAAQGVADVSNNGIAVHDDKLYISTNAPAPSWLEPAFTADQMDPQKSQPLVYLRKGGGHRTQRDDKVYGYDTYDELMQFYAAFMMDKMPTETPSLPDLALSCNTQAFFGNAPDTGPLAGSLVLALKQPVAVGSIIVPDAGRKVWALKPGHLLSGITEAAPMDVDLGGGDTMPMGPDITDDWVPLQMVGKPGHPGVALAPEGGIRTSALRYQTKSLTFSLALSRRFEDVAPQAEWVGAEGAATSQSGWSVDRAGKIISDINPGIAALKWNKIHALRGVVLWNPSPSVGLNQPGRIAVDAWIGPATGDPAQNLSKDSYWRQLAITQVGDDVVYTQDFGEVVSTSALRFRFLSSTLGNDGVYHAGFSAIMVLSPLGGDPEGLPKDLNQRITVLDSPAVGDDKGMATIDHIIPMAHPTQLAFSPNGTLYAVSDGEVVTVPLSDGQKSRVVIPRDQIVDATGMACDLHGFIYVTDNGPKVVKVFDPTTGKQVRTIGTPGGQIPGKWNPDTFANPAGLAVDKLGRAWVTDYTYVPKRIERFTPDGLPDKAFLGPTQYGGGGTMDSRDRNLIYYMGMKFVLNWETHTWVLDSILGHNVERVFYYQGHRYLVGPVHGGPVALITQERDHVAVPMAAMGELGAWNEIAKHPDLQKAFGSLDGKMYLFVWYDKNGDGVPQANEVQIIRRNEDRSTWTVGEDLGFVEVPSGPVGTRLRPTGVLADGVPTYDLNKLESFTTFIHGPGARTNNVWEDDKGRIFMIGTRLIDSDGKKLLWEYYNPWAMHDGYYASGFGYNRPPGVLNQEHFPIGHIKLKDGQGVEQEYYITNSDEGDWFCYTADGMLVGCIMGGPAGYGKKYWTMPEWTPGKVDLSDLRPGQEHYQGCVVCPDGVHVYAIAGHNHMSVVRVDGLGQLQRFSGKLTVTPEDVAKTQAWQIQRAMMAQAHQEPKILKVVSLENPLDITGSLESWPSALFVTISQTLQRGLRNNYLIINAQGALAFDENNLYVAIRARDDKPMRNSSQEPAMIFKGGDAAEVTLGTDPTADPKRLSAGVGDLRILMSVINGKPVAVLYKPVDPTAPADKHMEFQSPVGRLHMDRVEVIADAQVAVSTTMYKGKGDNVQPMWVVEAAIPWKSIGVTPPKTGMKFRGDLGVLQADENGMRTVNRLYWSGKTQTVVSDIPSEARLSPSLWGEFDFVAPTNDTRFRANGPEDPGL